MLLGSAQSDSTSGPRSESSVEASSNSNAYNATLKPLKSKPPERQLLDQAGDMLPAEAIMEQFDRAQQYVLKNRGEFTAEQQDKLQVWHRTSDMLHDHSFVVSVMCASHRLKGPSSTRGTARAISPQQNKPQVWHQVPDVLPERQLRSALTFCVHDVALGTNDPNCQPAFEGNRFQIRTKHTKGRFLLQLSICCSSSLAMRLMCCRSRAMFMTLLARRDHTQKQAALCFTRLLLWSKFVHTARVPVLVLSTPFLSFLLVSIQSCSAGHCLCRCSTGRDFSFLFPILSLKLCCWAAGLDGGSAGVT